MRFVWVMVLVASASAGVGRAEKAMVAADGSAKFKTLQAAVDALPDAGGEIAIAPGTYREKVTILKANVRLVGLGKQPEDVVLVFDANAGSFGGTSKTATLTAVGDGFAMRNMTVQNDWSVEHPEFDLNHNEGGQAVALMLRGDKDVIEHVRLLGAQDTLSAGGGGHCGAARTRSTSLRAGSNDASRVPGQNRSAPSPASVSGGQSNDPCRAVRQFFHDCYIEGSIDFIFGDANAVFQDCEIHGIANERVWLTAQSKDLPGRQSVYVFDHCRVTADERIGKLFLGRPWRPYGSVVYLNTKLDAKVDPAGWDDWVHTPGSITTAFFAEYGSTGRGALVIGREMYAYQLTAAEAAAFVPAKVLAGTDGWRPAGVRQGLGD